MNVLYKFCRKIVSVDRVNGIIKAVWNCFVSSCALSFILLFFSEDRSYFMNDSVLKVVVLKLFIILINLSLFIWFLRTFVFPSKNQEGKAVLQIKGDNLTITKYDTVENDN